MVGRASLLAGVCAFTALSVLLVAFQSTSILPQLSPPRMTRNRSRTSQRRLTAALFDLDDTLYRNHDVPEAVKSNIRGARADALLCGHVSLAHSASTFCFSRTQELFVIPADMFSKKSRCVSLRPVHSLAAASTRGKFKKRQCCTHAPSQRPSMACAEMAVTDLLLSESAALHFPRVRVITASDRPSSAKLPASAVQSRKHVLRSVSTSCHRSLTAPSVLHVMQAPHWMSSS